MPIIAVLVATVGTELRGEPGEPEPGTSDRRDSRE